MKNILLLFVMLIIGLPWGGTQERAYTTNTSSIRKCSHSSNVANSDKPDWSYETRLRSLSGRKELVRIAAEKAINSLKKCGLDVGVNYVLGNFKDGCSDKQFRCGDIGPTYLNRTWLQMCESWNPPNRSKCWVSQTLVTIGYKQVAPDINIFAENRLTEKFSDVRIGPTHIDRTKLPVVKEQEWFRSTIEIYPDVFEQGGYYMESEENSQEGPWAKTPIEALEYIILHELGHLNYFLAHEAKGSMLQNPSAFQVERMSRTEEETYADKFASYVWRCKN